MRHAERELVSVSLGRTPLMQPAVRELVSVNFGYKKREPLGSLFVLLASEYLDRCVDVLVEGHYIEVRCF